MLEHLPSVGNHVVGEEHGHRQSGLVELLLQDALALDQRRAPQVEAFEEEEVEGEKGQRLLPPAGECGLQFGEIRPPVLHHDHFAVDDGSLDRGPAKASIMAANLRVQSRPVRV